MSDFNPPSDPSPTPTSRQRISIRLSVVLYHAREIDECIPALARPLRPVTIAADTAQRLNNACGRALEYKAESYDSVKKILIKGLDRYSDNPALDVAIIHHDNIRGSEYYQGDNLSPIYET